MLDLFNALPVIGSVFMQSCTFIETDHILYIKTSMIETHMNV